MEEKQEKNKQYVDKFYSMLSLSDEQKTQAKNIRLKSREKIKPLMLKQKDIMTQIKKANTVLLYRFVLTTTDAEVANKWLKTILLILWIGKPLQISW